MSVSAALDFHPDRLPHCAMLVHAAVAAYLVLGEPLPAAAGSSAVMIFCGVIPGQVPPSTVEEAAIDEAKVSATYDS